MKPNAIDTNTEATDRADQAALDALVYPPHSPADALKPPGPIRRAGKTRQRADDAPTRSQRPN